MFQICPECDSQQDLSPYDFCQVCGHEWTVEEIRSSTSVPLDAGCSHAYTHDTQPADYKFCPWCGGEHRPRQ